MPQVSKKAQIAQAALPLFLNHGIKGTSVDMVVKIAGVSKPTVYNHFPDKSVLLDYVVERWLAEQPKEKLRATFAESVMATIQRDWLSDEAVGFYRLFSGEGYRAETAAQRFLKSYHEAWLLELKTWCATHNAEYERLESQVSQQILERLLYSGQETSSQNANTKTD